MPHSFKSYEVEILERLLAPEFPEQDLALPKAGSTSSVTATEETRRMVGHWGIDGEVVLIIGINGNHVVVSAPQNDTWRMDILDAGIVEDTIHFTQKHYLHDGNSHPFNGVACHCIAKRVDDDTLELGMTAEKTPGFGSDLPTRDQ